MTYESDTEAQAAAIHAAFVALKSIKAQISIGRPRDGEGFPRMAVVKCERDRHDPQQVHEALTAAGLDYHYSVGRADRIFVSAPGADDEGPYEAGDAVRFTDGPLGTVVDPSQRGFEDEVVLPGDTGTYRGKHPHVRHMHLVDVEIDGRKLMVPVDLGNVEPAAVVVDDEIEVEDDGHADEFEEEGTAAPTSIGVSFDPEVAKEIEGALHVMAEEAALRAQRVKRVHDEDASAVDPSDVREADHRAELLRLGRDAVEQAIRAFDVRVASVESEGMVGQRLPDTTRTV